MTRYTSATDADRAQMLAEIGVSSIEELFADIPASLRLPDGLGPLLPIEAHVLAEVLANRAAARRLCKRRELNAARDAYPRRFLGHS